MSSCQSSLALSVKELTTQESDQSPENSAITCCLYLNSTFFSAYTLKQLQDSISIPSIALEDIIQLIFFKNEQKEVFGSISFASNEILGEAQQAATKWVTLSDNINQDLISTKVDGDALHYPEALISLEVKGDITLMKSPLCKKKSFEDYLKQRNQYTDPSLFSETDHFQVSQEESAFKTKNFPLRLIDNLEIPPFNPVSRNSVDHTLNHEVRNTPDSAQHSKTGTFIGLPSQGTLNKDVESIQGIETRASISSLTFEKQILYQAEERDSNFLKQIPKTAVQEELDTHSQLTMLTCKNDKLEEEVKQLKALLQRSENENNQESFLIQKQISKFTALQEDFDRLKVNSVKNETIMQKMEQAYQEMETQLTETENSRLNLAQEKEELVFSLQQKDLFCSQLTEQINDLANSNLTLQKEIQLQKTKIDDLKDENLNLKQQLNLQSSQIENDEKEIFDLQQEIFTLREKEVQTLGIKDMLEEAFETIKSYEESLAGLTETCNIDQNNNESIFETLKNYIINCQTMNQDQTKQLEEMKNFIEDLTVKVSFHGSRRKDCLHLEGDLLNQLKILENDRDFLKDELSKTNENYFKLTQKYIELSDTLANLQKNTQYPQPPQPSLSPKTTTLTNYQKTNRNDEGIDEIEAKLIEFLIYYKLEPSILTKIEKGVYLYNDKKVYIKVCNGHLIVKTGDSHKPLQEFLKVRNCTSPLARTLHAIVRNSKKGERSFEKKSKYLSPNRGGTQLTDCSQRDLSFDLVSSRSFLKESTRNTIRPHVVQSPTDKRTSEIKPRSNGNLKLREILSSKSAEKKLSINSYQSK